MRNITSLFVAVVVLVTLIPEDADAQLFRNRRNQQARNQSCYCPAQIAAMQRQRALQPQQLQLAQQQTRCGTPMSVAPQNAAARNGQNPNASLQPVAEQSSDSNAVQVSPSDVAVPTDSSAGTLTSDAVAPAEPKADPAVILSEPAKTEAVVPAPTPAKSTEPRAILKPKDG